MKKLLVFAALFVVVLNSCSKDDDQAEAPENILAKTVTKEDGSSDSLVTTFSYDSQNRLVSENTDGDDFSSSRTFTRDNNGRVTRQTDTESQTGTASETSVIDFVYLAASGPTVKNGLELFTLDQGLDIRDSIAYAYAGNKVSKTEHYWKVPSVPTFPPTIVEFWEYQYDSRGNMTEARYFADVSTDLSGATLQATLRFQYDDKPSPFYTNDDALAEEVFNQYVSPNNPTKLDILIPGEPQESVTITYEYRSDGRPTKSTTVGGGITQITTFTYRR
jgi:YD repeat-containing protein